jgi:hypothetical protein
MAKKGKLLEYLVQRIERSISPDNIVEHDIQIPILNSQTNATTQCDIVIRSGAKGRETITIIEVQDRSGKPTANDFRGWQHKRKEIGAQHLICVSRQGFTKSQKDTASRSGSVIRLVTLKELPEELIPLDFFKFNSYYDDFKVASMHIEPSYSRREVDKLGIREKIRSKNLIGINENLFSENRVDLISVYNLLQKYFNWPEGKASGINTITFECGQEPNIWMFEEGHFFKVGLKITFDWTYEKIIGRIGVLSYEQNNLGVMAWVLETYLDTPKGELSFKFPVTKCEDGYSLKLGDMMAKIPNDVNVHIYHQKEIKK